MKKQSVKQQEESHVDAERLLTLMSRMKVDLEKISSKKPDSPVNEFKLSHVNNAIANANDVLGKDTPLQDFNQFEEKLLPTYSDVVFVLSQYIVALEPYVSDSLTLF